jgi:hypothetical protein
MDVLSIANDVFLVLGIVCMILAFRAFYVYALSRNDLLFVIGLAMANIGISVFCGYIQNIHLVTWNTQWAWYVGTIIGALFLVLGSFMRTPQQLVITKNWLIGLSLLYVVQILFTPILPQFSGPAVPVTLNIIRSVIPLIGFVRYLLLFSGKGTRFTLFMSLGFLLIGAGFGVLTPAIIDSTLAIYLVIGYSLRIVGYSLLLTAYSIG